MKCFLISVIVPIYKVEEYLDECVESIVNQTYTNLEIILVDDGSPDNCPRICDEWAKKDSRIKVLHKVNAGVSAARNSGIDMANGEYIIFVDGDDCLVKDIIEKVYVFSDNNKNNLCQFNYSYLIDKEIIKSEEIYIKNIDKNEMLTNLIAGSNRYSSNKQYSLGLYRAVWGKLLNTQIIKDNNLRFIESQYLGEDALFLFEYILHIKELRLLNEFGYLYRHNIESATRRYKDDLLEQCENEINTYLRLIREKNITFTDEISYATNNYIFNAYLAIINNEITAINQGNSTRKELLNKANGWIKQNKTLLDNKTPVFRITTKLRKIVRILYGKIPNKFLTLVVYHYFRLQELKNKKGK